MVRMDIDVWHVLLRQRQYHLSIEFLDLFIKPKKKQRRSSVVVHFREVSGTVWVSFEAVVIEKTIEEECTNKKYFYDNYNYYSD